MSNTSRTDWARIDATTDEKIDTTDIPPLSEEFFDKAQLRFPASSLTVTARVDYDCTEKQQSPVPSANCGIWQGCERSPFSSAAPAKREVSVQRARDRPSILW